MSNEEEKRCPLCAEEMDWTDQQLKPCKCGYEVCVWCWHHIMDMAEKEAADGRCPACRTPYDKDRIVGLEANFKRVAANSSSRKQKQPKAKQKPNEGKKDLSNVRVIQRKMAYIIGLPLSLADEDLLQRKDYFGQYGKVTKVSLSRTAGGSVQQFVNDTCSVYITYSKEEEAVRCIQSVHGYVLDGRFLRASFGTAKYCHTWLRNMPCNNVGCLYLHSIGAEEDSFGKDEIAAVHTRNRVQEIVGATQYLHKRSGSVLPPPVDEHLNSHSNPSPEEPIFSSGLRDVAYSTVASGDHHLPCSKDKDVIVKSSKHMTSFVDIVGRSSNSGSDKDVNSVAEGRILNLCSDMSSRCIDKINHDQTKCSDLVPSKSSTPGQFINGMMNSKVYSEPYNITKEQSGFALDSRSSDWERWEDSIAFGQKAPLNPSYYADEVSKMSTCTNSEGNNEKRFQSLAKSDRIYRCSRSFSNEEIVEHLRRLDDGTVVDNDENSAAVESSIISNILSMDLDGCDDSVLPQTVAGLFEGKDGRHGSSWNFQNNDQSRFSFANEHGYSNQEMEKFSVHDFGENQDSIYQPHNQVSRAQNLTPPGFSKPPPGFPSCRRTEQVIPTNYVLSGSHMTSNHYRTPSIGNLSNSSDDLIEPAIMAGRGKSGSTSFDEETKLWLLMQQQQSASATQYSQTSFMQQHQPPPFSSSQDDYYRQQRYLQPKYANGYQQLHVDESQQVNGRSEVGFQERNERLGLNRLLQPGYGDYMFQMPSSGDLYTRVFGM